MYVCICSQVYVHMIDTEHAATFRSSHRAPYLAQCPPFFVSEPRAGYEPTAYYAVSLTVTFQTIRQKKWNSHSSSESFVFKHTYFNNYG